MGKGNNNGQERTNKLPEWVKNAKESTLDYIKKAPSVIWQKFKESLLPSIIKACFLIFALIYLVFLVKPSRAHILVNISELSGLTNLSAEKVVLDNPDCDEIGFFSDEAVYIRLKDCEIEEVSSDVNRDSSWLVIYPKDNETANTSHFFADGKVSSVNISNASSRGLSDYTYDKSVCKFVGPINLFISTGRVVFESYDGKVVAEPDIFSYTIRKKKTSEEKTNAASDDEQSIELEFENSFVKKGHGNYGEKTITSIVEYGGGELLASGITHFESNATGELTFSYTPNPQEYRLYKQELVLNSNSFLDLELEYSTKHNADDDTYESEGVLYGYVLEGEFSKMSLFPSFKTWFYSNAYMTPTAIIAVVLTAVGIFNKKDK